MIVIVSCDNLVFVVLDLQSMVVSDCCGDLGLVMLVLDCLGENLFGFQELIRKLKGDPLQKNKWKEKYFKTLTWLFFFFWPSKG